MKKNNFKQFLLNLNCVKWTIIFIFLLCFGIIFGYVLFPKILKTIMKMVDMCEFVNGKSASSIFPVVHILKHCILLQQLKLTPGTQMRDMFTEVPFPLDFKIYIFNVTNKDEVNVGAKPKLQEIGPFYFELSVSHFTWAALNIEFNFNMSSVCLQRMESEIRFG